MRLTGYTFKVYRNQNIFPHKGRYSLYNYIIATDENYKIIFIMQGTARAHTPPRYHISSALNPIQYWQHRFTLLKNIKMRSVTHFVCYYCHFTKLSSISRIYLRRWMCKRIRQDSQSAGSGNRTCQPGTWRHYRYCTLSPSSVNNSPIKSKLKINQPI